MAPPLNEAEADDGGEMLTRYQAAEAVLDTNVAGLVLNESVTPNWVGGSTFWYRRQRHDGADHIWVEGGAARPAFDHAAAAAALGSATGAPIEPWDLTVEAVFADGGLVLRHEGRRWRVAAGSATDLGSIETLPSGVLVSPDGKHGLIARGHDLYLRALGGGPERRLTDDGEADFAWGQHPDAGLLGIVRRRSGLPFPPHGWSWSPDAAFLIGGRVDERHIQPYPFLESVPLNGDIRPRTWNIRQAMVGERGPIFSACTIEVATGRRISIDLPDPLAAHLDELEPLGWSGDGRRAFVAAPLDTARKGVLFEIDVASGRVRMLLTEQADGFLKLGSEMYKRHSSRILAGGRRAIWYSERSGFGHLYLYDLETGALINPVTSGDWLVRDILTIDEGQGRVYFTGSGREGGDPYQRRVYRVDLDGGNLVLLSPEVADHMLEGAPAPLIARLYGTPEPPSAISPDSSVFVDSWSTVSEPGVSVLRSTEDGVIILPLEVADASRLYATGWRPPETFVVKAADGVTDLHGVLFRPRYRTGVPAPVVDAIYGGPQVTVTPRNFRAARCGIGSGVRAALAALGFAVIVVDGRGTPLRSRAFHDAGFDAFADTCLDDHVAALQQILLDDPSLDGGRVGVYGHSFGGYAAARAVLRHPDVYSVAVSSAGTHNLHGLYAQMISIAPAPDYGAGAPEKPDGKAIPVNYRPFDNAPLAANLRGRLLLAYGDMDENVYPAVTLQMCDALNRANRSYDLLYFPNAAHSFPTDPYFKRRLWDYFVEHLLGETPPLNYAIGGGAGAGVFA